MKQNYGDVTSEPELSFDETFIETSLSLSYEARKLKAEMRHRSPTFSDLGLSISSHNTPEMIKNLLKTMPVPREKSPRFDHKEETKFMTAKKLTKKHGNFSFSQDTFEGVKFLKNEEFDCASRLNSSLSLHNFHKQHLVEYREILMKKVRKDRLEMSEKRSQKTLIY